MLIDRTVILFGFIKFGREVLDIAAANIKPGVTADEIDRIVHEVRNNNYYNTWSLFMSNHCFVMVNFI